MSPREAFQVERLFAVANDALIKLAHPATRYDQLAIPS
jgi:hypothetical protein